MGPQENDRIRELVVSRLRDRYRLRGEQGEDLRPPLEDALYHERRRLRQFRRKGRGIRAEQAFLGDLGHRLKDVAPQERVGLVGELVQHYANQVTGHFSEPV